MPTRESRRLRHALLTAGVLSTVSAAASCSPATPPDNPWKHPGTTTMSQPRTRRRHASQARRGLRRGRQPRRPNRHHRADLCAPGAQHAAAGGQRGAGARRRDQPHARPERRPRHRDHRRLERPALAGEPRRHLVRTRLEISAKCTSRAARARSVTRTRPATTPSQCPVNTAGNRRRQCGCAGRRQDEAQEGRRQLVCHQVRVLTSTGPLAPGGGE